MPEHKMVVFDGIRYRPEDAPARPAPADETPPAPAAEEVPPAGGGLFDPSAHNAPDVLAHLLAADEDERARVLAAEAAGKARKGILEATFPPPGTSGGAAS